MPCRPPLRKQRQTLLIVGCGDVGLRVLKLVGQRWRVSVLTSSPARVGELRAAGARPLIGNLDDAASLRRLAGLAQAVLYLAPPSATESSDVRLSNLLHALALRGRVARFVYASTSGVYGDCQGALISETQRLNPQTERARRRVDAEAQVRHVGRTLRTRVSVLRIPGIYALDRAGGDPRERVKRGAPVLNADNDFYSNHIHADDLARICVAALLRGRPQRVVHASDNTAMKAGDYFDVVADTFGLPRPPRIAWDEACRTLSALQLSFMNESRRLDNTRLKRELRVRLRYPTVREGLAAPGGQ